MSPVPIHIPIRRRGVTLIEAVLFISVALGLIVGGIVFYQQASLSGRLGQQVRVLSALAVEARAIYALEIQTTDLRLQDLDEVLVASGSAPASIIAETPGSRRGSRLRHEWGGELSARIQNMGAAEVLIFLELYDLPVAACARLAPLEPQGQPGEMNPTKGVFTNGIWNVSIGEDDASFRARLIQGDGPDVAAAACADADDNGNGLVTLTFLLLGVGQ